MAHKKGGNRTKRTPKQDNPGAAHINVGGQGEDLPDYSPLVGMELPVMETHDPLAIPVAQTAEQEQEAAQAIPDTQQESVEPPAEQVQVEEESQDHLPTWANDPRFKDKGPDDIYGSYKELESKLGTQADEIKQYRKFFDQYMLNQQMQGMQQPQAPGAEPDSDPENVQMVEQMLTNPKGFFRDLQSQFMQGLKAQAQQNEVYRMKEEHKATLNSPEFASWMTQNIPYQFAQQADTDPKSLHFVLESYKRASAPQQATQDAQEALARSAKVVQAAAGAPPTGRPSQSAKVWSRRELMTLQLTDPHKYSALQPEIMKAYQEGRVKD